MSDAPADLRPLIGYAFEPYPFTYTERDVCLYALGIGCPLDGRELRFVYEQHADFAVFPTFAVIYASPMIETVLANRVPGLHFDPMLLLHGEQRTAVLAPLPTSGTIICKPVIADIYDKGKGALILIDAPCYASDGRQLVQQRFSFYIRGLGGYGGERGASIEAHTPPDRAPDATIRQATMPTQALIYRLSGDYNPLHADPAQASAAGFSQPILHGLATFGCAARHALLAFGADAARFRQMTARFAKPVFPGDTLITDLWDMGGGEIVLRTLTAERGEVVLSSASITVAE